MTSFGVIRDTPCYVTNHERLLHFVLHLSEKVPTPALFWAKTFFLFPFLRKFLPKTIHTVSEFKSTWFFKLFWTAKNRPWKVFLLSGIYCKKPTHLWLSHIFWKYSLLDKICAILPMIFPENFNTFQILSV